MVLTADRRCHLGDDMAIPNRGWTGCTMARKVNWTDEADQTHTGAGEGGKSGWRGSCSPGSKPRWGGGRDCVLLQWYQKFYASTVNSVIKFCSRGHITLCSEWTQFELSKLWNSWVIRPQGHMMPSRYSTYLHLNRCFVCCCTSLISLFSYDNLL